MKDTAAEASKSKMRVSLNCLRNLNHRGSGSSCGSSFAPYRRSLASASEGDRPRVSDVFSRCLVSSGVRSEYAEVPAYESSQSML